MTVKMRVTPMKLLQVTWKAFARNPSAIRTASKMLGVEAIASTLGNGGRYFVKTSTETLESETRVQLASEAACRNLAPKALRSRFAMMISTAATAAAGASVIQS